MNMQLYKNTSVKSNAIGLYLSGLSKVDWTSDPSLTKLLAAQVKAIIEQVIVDAAIEGSDALGGGVAFPRSWIGDKNRSC